MGEFIGPLKPGQIPSQSNPSSLVVATTSNSDIKNDVGKTQKSKKFIRFAGGATWDDPSLSEWDPNDYRAFCGDLGNEVTDEMLTKTFEKYTSFVKARVIRDKRTGKSKGYGFVSFKDSNDFAKAVKEWDRQYLGSRPIKLRKSTWRDRNIEVKRTKIPNTVNSLIQKEEDAQKIN